MGVATIAAPPEGVLVKNPKTGTTYDSPADHQLKMLQFRDRAREEAFGTQQMHIEASKVHEYIRFLEGKHWPSNHRPWRSSLYTNRMAMARLDTLATLTDIKPTLDVSPEFSSPDMETQARIAQNLIQSEWLKRGFGLDLVSAVDHGLLASGFWKIGGTFPGRLHVTSCGFDNVLPIQPTGRLQSAGGVLYRAFKALAYFYQKWPKKANGLEKYAVPWPSSTLREEYERPDNFTELDWKSASPQFRWKMQDRTKSGSRGMSSRQTYFPMLPLEEYWVEDYNTATRDSIVKDPELELDDHNWWYRVAKDQRLFPGKRLIVFGGDRLMYDGPNPYFHGMYPFSELQLNPVVWGYGSISRYRDLLPLNKAMNEIISGIQELIRRAINPQIVAREGSVALSDWRDFWQDRAGEKLLMMPRSDPSRDIQWIKPPPIPSYVYMMLMNFLAPEFEKMSGFLDIANVARKNQIPGGDTIEQMRDSLQTQLKLESLRIEQFLLDAGQLALSNIFQFFTMPQRLHLLGPDGITYQDYDYDPEQMTPYMEPKREYWSRFSLRVSQGSLLGSSQDRRKQMAISLYKGRIISRRELLRVLEWGNVDQIERELQQEMEQQAQMQEAAAEVKGMPRMTRGQRTGEAM